MKKEKIEDPIERASYLMTSAKGATLSSEDFRYCVRFLLSRVRLPEELVKARSMIDVAECLPKQPVT